MKSRIGHTYQICLLVWGLSSNSRISLILLRQHWRWRVAHFDLCLALMAIEQLGFFSVPHLLWHGASVYNIHLRRPMTLTHIAERLVVELSLLVFTTYVCRCRDSNTQPSACEAKTLFVSFCFFLMLCYMLIFSNILTRVEHTLIFFA